MINLNQITQMQEDIILNMNLQELKKYIDNLANEYYLHLLKKDKLNVNVILDNFNLVVKLHNNLNIENYINYALIVAFNKLLLNSIDNDLDLNQLELKEPNLKRLDNKMVNNPFSNNINNIFDVIDYYYYKEVSKKADDFEKSITNKKELYDLFNYEDYLK